MSDNDLIRRGDALVACQGMDPEGDINAIPAVQPTVKPLVWEALPSREALCHGHWSAAALGGAYHTAPDEDSSAGAWLLQWTLRDDDFCMKYGGKITQHTSPEKAKAAAQADYEARILSALDMYPTVSPDVAALVEALENVIGEYDLFRKYEYERGLAPLDDEIHEARAALARLKGAM